ncbi:MAG TPA: serine hydrolase [Verrucomicrobiales bacterium]|nr:serine hydrolase [Verrucomicrobiales bacterium]
MVGAPALVPLVTRLVEGALGPRPGATSRLRADELALTLIDLRTPGIPASASYRGDVQIYPASVVKLFYLGAAHRWMEDGRLQRSEELDRALRLMIVDSWNEASHYVLDLLTDTTSGPELAPEALEEWYRKRNAVNRYYESLGYRRVVANRKPWCEGPFGRERQSALQHAPYRNLLTTGETGRLLQEIVTRRMVTPARCDQMLSLLARDPVPKPNDPESQVKGFVGEGLPRGAKLWSKAGWTSDTRHDAACVELPDGRRFILVVFTTNHSEDEGLIPSIARQAVAGIPPLP